MPKKVSLISFSSLIESSALEAANRMSDYFEVTAAVHSAPLCAALYPHALSVNHTADWTGMRLRSS